MATMREWFWTTLGERIPVSLDGSIPGVTALFSLAKHTALNLFGTVPSMAASLSCTVKRKLNLFGTVPSMAASLACTVKRKLSLQGTLPALSASGFDLNVPLPPTCNITSWDTTSTGIPPYRTVRIWASCSDDDGQVVFAETEVLVSSTWDPDGTWRSVDSESGSDITSIYHTDGGFGSEEVIEDVRCKVRDNDGKYSEWAYG